MQASIQNQKYWFFLDTGSGTNIIDEEFYNSLPCHPCPAPPNSKERLLSAHNIALPVVGTITLPMSFDNNTYYHPYKVVKNFPIDLRIGAEFMKPHEFSLTYRKGVNLLEVFRNSCPTCVFNFARSVASTPSDPPIAASKKSACLTSVPISIKEQLSRPPRPLRLYPVELKEFINFTKKFVQFNVEANQAQTHWSSP